MFHVKPTCPRHQNFSLLWGITKQPAVPFPPRTAPSTAPVAQSVFMNSVLFASSLFSALRTG